MPDKANSKHNKVIEQYIDENLKQVFSQYANEDMPTDITDLLSVLKAQDQEKGK